MHRLVALAIILLATVAPSVSFSAEIKVGLSAPLTGVQAQAGQDVVDHLTAAFKDLNATAAFGKHTATLVFTDDGYEPARTAANIERMCAEGVALFMNQIGSANLQAAIPSLKKCGRQMFAPLSGPQLAYNDPVVIPFRASYLDEVGYLFRQFQIHGVKNVTVIHQNDAFGKDVLGSALKLSESSGLTITSITKKQDGSDDAAVLAHIAADSTDAVIVALVTRPAMNLLKKRASAGIGMISKPIALLSVAVSSEFTSASDSSLAGTIVTVVVPWIYAKASPIQAKYHEFITNHKLKPSLRGAEAWLSAHGLAEAIRTMKRNTSTAVNESIAALPSFTVSGKTFPLRGRRFIDSGIVRRDGSFYF